MASAIRDEIKANSISPSRLGNLLVEIVSLIGSSEGSTTTDVLATKLSGLDLSLKGTTVSQSLSVLQAFGVIFGRLNDGKKMRVALSSSGIIMGFENRGTEDSRISTLVLLNLESSKIYWKSNASYDITMMSDADEIESLLKSEGAVINLGAGPGSTDVLGTTAKAGGYQAKQTVEESDDIESVLSSLTAFSNNGRFSINSDDTGMLIVSRNADTGGTNIGLRLLTKEDGSIELRGTVTTNGVLVHRLCNTQGNAGSFVSKVMETSKSWPLIMSNSGNSISVDSSLSSSSENPVQNKVVKTALDGKQDKLGPGENIKTLNGMSLLGEGDIVADGVELYEVHNAFPENLEIMPGKIYSVPSSGGMVQSVSLTVKKYTLSSSTGQQNLKKLETKLYVSDYYNMNFTAEAGLTLYKSDYGQPPQKGGIRVFTINWIQSGLEQYAVLNCMDFS